MSESAGAFIGRCWRPVLRGVCGWRSGPRRAHHAPARESVRVPGAVFRRDWTRHRVPMRRRDAVPPSVGVCFAALGSRARPCRVQPAVAPHAHLHGVEPRATRAVDPARRRHSNRAPGRFIRSSRAVRALAAVATTPAQGAVTRCSASRRPGSDRASRRRAAKLGCASSYRRAGRYRARALPAPTPR